MVYRGEKAPRRRVVHDTLVNELVDDQGGPAGDEETTTTTMQSGTRCC